MWLCASRSDVMNEIDRDFDVAGVYPPFMSETSPGTYEGEIDKGWILKVQDSPRKYELNGWVVQSIPEAVDAYVNRSQKFLSPPPLVPTSESSIVFEPVISKGRMAEFRVKTPYADGILSMEFDGRDLEWDGNNPDDVDHIERVMIDVQASPAYQEAQALYDRNGGTFG